MGSFSYMGKLCTAVQKRQKRKKFLNTDIYNGVIFDKIWGVWVAEETLYQVFDMFSWLNWNYNFQFSMPQSLQYDFLCIKPVELFKYIWGTMLKGGKDV